MALNSATRRSSVANSSSSVPWLVVWGLAGLVNYAILAYLSRLFIFGYGHTHRPIVQVVGLLTAAWITWIAACYVVFRRIRPENTAPSSLREEVWPLAIILLFGLAYRLVLVPTRPIQEADLYRYLWDGLLTVHGINPYAYTPMELADRMAWAYHEHLRGRPLPQDQLQLSLSRMLDESQVHNRRLMQLALAHHGQMPTTYPPMAQVIFASVAGLCSDSWSVEERATLLRIVLVAFDLGTLAILLRILWEVNWPLSWCVAYAWCPLVMKEVANSGHVESVAVFFCTLAWWLIMRKHWAWAGFSWALAVLTKAYPVALLPIVAGWIGGRGGALALARFFAPAAVAILGSIWLFQPLTPGRSTTTGLAIFLREWETNDLLFQQTKHLLTLCLPDTWQEHIAGWSFWPRRVATGEPVEQETALALWSALAGSSVAAEVQRFGLLPVSPTFVLAYVIHALIYLGIAVVLTYWALRSMPSAGPDIRPHLVRSGEISPARHVDAVWLRATFLALAWLFLLLPTGNPWYFLWALPWILWTRQQSWYLLPGLLAQYYLYFWFVYHHPGNEPGVWHTGLPGYKFFHKVWVWLEYAPFFVCLLLEWLASKKRPVQE